MNRYNSQAPSDLNKDYFNILARYKENKIKTRPDKSVLVSPKFQEPIDGGKKNINRNPTKNSSQVRLGIDNSIAKLESEIKQVDNKVKISKISRNYKNMQTEQPDTVFGKRQQNRTHLVSKGKGMKIGHDNEKQYVPNKPKGKSSLQQYIGGVNSESSDFVFNRQLSARERDTPPKTIFHKKMNRTSGSTLDGVLRFKGAP